MPLNLPAPVGPASFDRSLGGFAAHGVTHSSPSSINMWANAPCAWIGKYLLKRQFAFSHAALAGTLAEEAVVNVLGNGWTQEAASCAALASYNKVIAFGASGVDRKRGDAIDGMINIALSELKRYGEPDMTGELIYGKKQKKIELLCKGAGWELPVIGYLDFYFPQHGLVIDLKTTMRLPSEMSDEHLRQGCVYRAAMGNAAVKFLYVSGKDKRIHDIPEPTNALSEVKAILTRQERFLQLGDAETLRSVVPVNAGSYYWAGDSALRREIYGI